MPRSTHRVYILLLAAAALVGVFAYCCMPWWTVDDAWISYRYGKNLLESGELTWNPGEPKVEGYTGILLPMLAAGMLLLGLPLASAVKVLGIGAALGTAVLFEHGLRRLDVDPLRRGIATLLLAMTPLLYLHSTSGLETIFFTFAITWVIHNLCDPVKLFAEGKNALGMGFGLLLAGLCRPEGIALAVIVLVHLFLLRKRFNALIFKTYLIKIVALGLAPLLTYWCWRMWYYEALLPNSYFAKAYEGFANVESLWAFAKFIGYYCAIPALAALLLAGLPSRERISGQVLLLRVGLTFIACCLAAYFHANLWMNYGSRFFFPLLPMIGMLLAYFSIPSTPFPCKTPWKMVVLSALLLLQLGVMGFRFKQEWAFLDYYHRIVQDELIPVGKYLKENLPANATVISYMDAGAVGYYSGLKVIDFGRLSDAYLARQHPDAEAVRDYFFGQQAEAVVMSSENADGIQYIDEAMQIVADPRFQDYEHVATWGNRAEYPYWQHLFLRREVVRK